MNLKSLSIAVHLRMVGAAGFGYIVGHVDKQPTYGTLAVACASAAATVIGWILMRPQMREAKRAISRTSAGNSKPGDRRDANS